MTLEASGVPLASPSRGRSSRAGIVDALKVLCLTVSSPVFMHRLPPGSLRRFVSTNLLRNAHKVLEAVL